MSGVCPRIESRQNTIVDISLENHWIAYWLNRDIFNSHSVCLALFCLVLLFFLLLFFFLAVTQLCLNTCNDLGNGWDQLNGLYFPFFHDISPESLKLSRRKNTQKKRNTERERNKKIHAEECDSGGYLDLCIDFIFIPFLTLLACFRTRSSHCYIINVQPHKPFAFNLD